MKSAVNFEGVEEYSRSRDLNCRNLESLQEFFVLHLEVYKRPVDIINTYTTTTSTHVDFLKLQSHNCLLVKVKGCPCINIAPGPLPDESHSNKNVLLNLIIFNTR